MEKAGKTFRRARPDAMEVDRESLSHRLACY
jgi:hypothetical protein